MKTLALLRLLALALGLAAAAPAQDGAAPSAGATPPGIMVRRDLAYNTEPHQKLDLYYPLGRMTKPRPVIVFIHDGGWSSGSKADGRTLAYHFVAQGFAVACIDYRLSNEALFPAQIEDVKGALRWLRRHAVKFGLDPEHFGAVGASAGGHLAALTGAMNSARLYESGDCLEQHSRVQAVVDYSGPIDLARLFEASLLKDEIAALFGGPPSAALAPARASNPTFFLDNESPPMLLIHGDQDTTVPLEQSRLLYDAMLAKRLSAHLHIIKGAGHTGPAFAAPSVQARVDAFLNTVLKPGETAIEAPAITESEAGQ